jgi:hypothetical protein
MYHQFNIQQFYFLPTQCIYVFCVDLRTIITGEVELQISHDTNRQQQTCVISEAVNAV